MVVAKDKSIKLWLHDIESVFRLKFINAMPRKTSLLKVAIDRICEAAPKLRDYKAILQASRLDFTVRR